MTLTQARDLLGKALQRWNENNAARMAAAVAFYAILAFAPLLLFAIAAGGQFLSAGEIKQSIIRETRLNLGQGATTLVQTMLDSEKKPGADAVASVISIGLALLGASGLFNQLNLAVQSIWKVGPPVGSGVKHFFLSYLVSVLMVLGFVTLILAWIGIDSVVSYVKHHTDRQLPLWHLVSFFVSVAFLTVVFGIAFKSLARGMVAWRDVWLPALLTAIGFSLAKYLLSLYFGLSSVPAQYGPAGALVVILLWFYYSSQIFFFGVELTYVYAHDYGSRRGATAPVDE